MKMDMPSFLSLREVIVMSSLHQILLFGHPFRFKNTNEKDKQLLGFDNCLMLLHFEPSGACMWHDTSFVDLLLKLQLWFI